MIRVLAYALALMALVAAPLRAQEDNAEEAGGLLVDFLQDTLSDDSRTVRVRGLDGAFSSRATIEELTISDDDGVWLTLRGAVLDWNRLALVRGRFSVNTLSADEIIIARKPGTTTTEEELPSPEATPFKVPDLPVSIELGELSVGRFVLEEPVIGHAAELGIDGFLTLADGSLDTSLTVTRLDRASDFARLEAGFSNATDLLRLDLDVTEASGGLISAALNMPGRPPVRLNAAGEGPVDDFAAIIGLSSDGIQRVSGEVRLKAAAPATEGGPAAGIDFAAGLKGDVTPFLPAVYHEFFGTRSRLTLTGQRLSDGALTLSDLSLETDAVRLQGQMAMNAGGRVDLVDLQGGIDPPDGQAVVLPVSGPATSIARADISVRMNRAEGDDWSVDIVADGVSRPDLTLEQARISGTGQVGDRPGSLQGQITAALSKMGFADAALAAAVGSDLQLDGGFALDGSGDLKLTTVTLDGEDYSATIDGTLRGLDSGFEMDGTVKAGLADLSRFSALAGQDLGGAVTAELTGKGAPLSGSFDIVLNARTQDLRAGIDQVDPLIGGQTVLTLDAVRDEAGTRIRRFELDGEEVTANVTGKARSGAADLTIRARIRDMAPVLPQLAGPLLLAADVTQQGNLWSGTADLAGRGYSANLDGTARPAEDGIDLSGTAKASVDDLAGFSDLAGRPLGGAITLHVEGTGNPQSQLFDLRLDAQARDLRVGIDQVDPLIAGRTVLMLDAVRDQAGTRIRQFDLDGEAVTADVTGESRPGAADLTVRARIEDMAPVLPQLAGPLLLAADVTQKGDLWSGTADLSGRGYSANLDGTARPTGDGIDLGGTAKASVDDLGRFSDLAGRPLGGAITLHVEGTGNPQSRLFDLRLEAQMQDLSVGIDRIDPLIAGRTVLVLDAARTEDGIDIRNFDLDGQELSASARGRVLPETGDLTFEAMLNDLNLLVPQLDGPLKLDGDVTLDREIWGGKVVLQGPRASRALLVGSMAPDGTARLDFDAELTRLERLVPTLAGTATAKGNALRSPDGRWTVDAGAKGPAGITASVDGGFDETSGQADLRSTGQLNLNLANLFIAPNSIDGLARFDLTLDGEPSLQALAGTVTASDARLAIPAAGQTVTGIDATVTIASGSADIRVAGGLRGNPGGFRVSGPLALTPPFDTRLTIDLNGLGLTDNVIYSTSLDGQLQFAGPLLRNPNLSGQIVFGETDINLNAATGAAGAAPIPPMTHVAEPGPVHATRERAGLVVEASPGPKTAIGLDLRLIARNRVYVHGFGLQAEMSGDIAIRGTTARIEPAGQIEMIRGSLDILGRKLKLTRGIITMQGNLRPYVEFQSTTSTTDGQATIEISGPINAPAVKVYADPERPAEEALAMLLFGNRFTELSPVVIAQMAASLARMGGAGGGGSKSLRDRTGIDSVGVGADESGNAQGRAGAYLSDNVYTEFTVNSEGETELNLNLDLTESLSVRGTVDNSGSTGLGIYFGRDY